MQQKRNGFGIMQTGLIIFFLDLLQLILIFLHDLLQTHKRTGSGIFHAALFNQNFRHADHHKDH